MPPNIVFHKHIFFHVWIYQETSVDDFISVCTLTNDVVDRNKSSSVLYWQQTQVKKGQVKSPKDFGFLLEHGGEREQPCDSIAG